MLFTFLLGGLSILALRTPYVQNKLLNIITSKLSDQLGTEVSIQRIGVSFPDKVVFNGVLVRDFNKDSLVYINRLATSFDKYDADQHEIELAVLELESPKIYFHRPKNGKFNYQELISKINGSSSSSGPSAVWTISFSKLNLSDGSFQFYNENMAEPQDRAFKENNIRLSGINLEAEDFVVVGDSLHFQLEHLSAKESSGMAIHDMQSEVSIASKGIFFDKLNLKTGNSVIKDEFKMITKNYASYAYFNDSVYMKGNLVNSEVDARDIAYFTNNLEGFEHNVLKMNGAVNGTLKKLKLRNTILEFGESSKLAVNGKIRGLPNWDDTYLDFNFKELNSNYQDLANFGLKDLLPEFLKDAGQIEYKGEFKGFHSDFITYGSVVSDVGMVSADLNFKVNGKNPETYSGRITGSDLELGKLLNVKELGSATFNLVLKDGKGLNINDFRTTFDGIVQEIYVNNYKYTSTTIKGLFQSKQFDGVVDIKDPNLEAKLRGLINYNARNPQYNVKAEVVKANLEKLGLVSTIQNVEGLATAQFTGLDIVNFNGKFNLASVKILREGVTIPLEKLEIKSESFDTSRRIVLNSDFVDLKLEGKFDFSEWEASTAVFFHDLFPDFYPLPEKRPKPADYKLSLLFKDHPFLTDITDSLYQFGSGSLNGRYSSAEQSLRVDGKLSTLGYEGYELENWAFNIIKEPHQLLNLSMDVAKLIEHGDLLTHDLIFDAHILPNQAEFLFNFADSSDEFALNSYGELNFTSDTVQAHFMESVFYLRGEEWVIAEENQIVYDRKGVHVDHLNILNDSSHVKIHGDITGGEKDTLELNLNNFNLALVSQFVDGSDFGGRAFGKLDLFRLAKDPFFHGDLLVEDLVYNDNYLGNLKVFSQAENDPLVMDVYALMQSGLIKDLELTGQINLHDDKQTMDLDVHLHDVSAKPLEELFEGLASNIDGLVSADLKAKGKFKKPKISGEVAIKKMGMTVDYIQTRYTATGKILIDENSLKMDNIQLTDAKDQRGLLTGTISHRYFDDLRFDLNFRDLNNFWVMNTTKANNEYFYGQAFVDGSMKVKGPIDDIFLDIYARTRKGTEIFIPLEHEAGSSNVSYITFVDFKDTASPVKVNQKIDGLTMSLIMDITPDAKTELIFDEFVNDKITGRGEGRIKMAISSTGQFDMYGSYTIEEGEYPISAFNTTPTKFILKKGGKIRWDGDPYLAKIDIEANILESVNPNDLLGNVDANASSENIEVECQLFLKGSLFSPEISFGLNVPGSGGSRTPTRFNAILNSIRADPDELNRQVFAIIVFGSFIPPTFADGPSAGGGDEIVNTVRNSVSGMISNQLSHWLSQGDNTWSFGIDWDQGSTHEREQLILEAKKYLFKEKLSVEGLYDVNSTNGSNPYDFIVSWEISDKLKVRTFRKLANDPTLGNSNTVTTTGVGLFYRKRITTKRNGGQKKDEEKSSSSQ